MEKFPYIICALLLLSQAPLMEAWGKEGHMMVCKIAQQYLSEKTLKAVLALLPESAGGDLATVCPWADEIRSQYRWSSILHFSDVPAQACNYEYSRDCHDSNGVNGNCIVGAISNYTQQLRRNGNPKNTYNLTESLMFLAHFVGDVHQPLHIGFVEDLGGNTIAVQWYNRKTNLHAVWDNEIPQTAMRNFYNNSFDTMVNALEAKISDEQAECWSKCCHKKFTCASDYANESAGLACEYAYKDVSQNATLGDDYFYSRFPVVETRISQAGVRLAMILNRIFDGNDLVTAM